MSGVFSLIDRLVGAREGGDEPWTAPCSWHVALTVDEVRDVARDLLRYGYSDFSIACSLGLDVSGARRLIAGAHADKSRDRVSCHDPMNRMAAAPIVGDHLHDDHDTRVSRILADQVIVSCHPRYEDRVEQTS